MTYKEKIKHIRDTTLSPISKIVSALKRANEDVDAAIKILISEKSADAADMANRVANASIVYSYVHNNKIGAMITLTCQTDFVAKNEVFQNLAKDICLHIVSTPHGAYIDESSVGETEKGMLRSVILKDPAMANKPPHIIDKIYEGRLQKELDTCCLMRHKFVKDDTITVKELINRASSTLGEKIQLKSFVRVVA